MGNSNHAAHPGIQVCRERFGNDHSLAFSRQAIHFVQRTGNGNASHSLGGLGSFYGERHHRRSMIGQPRFAKQLHLRNALDALDQRADVS